MTECSPYTLDAAQLENAVHALQKAAETLRPKPNEERLYRFLGRCVRVAFGAFAGMVLFYAMFGVAISKSAGADTAPVIVFALLMAGFIVLFFVAAIVALVFLLLNRSVIRQAILQRRFLKKLGIREVSQSAWKLQRMEHRWSRLAGAVLTWGGSIIAVLGFVGLITWTSFWISTEKESGRGVAITGCISYGLVVTFGLTVLVWRFVQRSREQWAIVADANRLRSVLESRQTKTGAGEPVAIPAAVVEHAAQIERVAIARERSDAVLASAATSDHGYGILVARDVSSRKRLLDPQQRVAVEDLFENLSSNPRPAAAESTPEGLLSVRTPEGNVGLQYSVDERAKRVHIVALTAHNYG